MKNIIVIFLLCFLVGCNQQTLYKDKRLMMGTFIEVTSAQRQAAEIAFAEIRRIEDLLSKYNPDSEVSRLNKSGKLLASPELFYIVRKSKEFWQDSNGAFDITVAPLVDLWGFSDKKYTLPQEKEIKKVLRFVGSDKILLHDENNMIQFSLSGTKIDLGAIAKGYALDCAAEKLKEKGIKRCLINAGGQVYALGDKFGQPWKIAIKNPRTQEFSGYLELKDQSVATSGDYEQYFIQGKKRYAHIFDPRTGYPADSGIISVTVIAPSGLIVDALATSIFVLGKEKGEALAKKFPGIDLKIIEERDVPHN